MNDSELKSALQSVRVPERSAEYWNDFPPDIRRQLPRMQREFAPRSVWRPRLQWAGGLALAVALMYVGERFHPLETASQAITKHERNLRVQVAQLESGLRLLMFNPHGMGYLLAEAN
jgi:hypothetical protein